jgi:hypothetical protein
MSLAPNRFAASRWRAHRPARQRRGHDAHQRRKHRRSPDGRPISRGRPLQIPVPPARSRRHLARRHRGLPAQRRRQHDHRPSHDRGTCQVQEDTRAFVQQYMDDYQSGIAISEVRLQAADPPIRCATPSTTSCAPAKTAKSSSTRLSVTRLTSCPGPAVRSNDPARGRGLPRRTGVVGPGRGRPVP